MPEPTSFDSPRLMADIGGTYARFAVEVAPGRFEHVSSLRVAEHADFHAAVRAYLQALPMGTPQHAAVAIANPVEGDQVRMTNYHWQFSIEEMRQRLRLDTLVVVNDFTALAMAIPHLRPHELRQVGGGQPRPRSVVGLLGSGSGLGVSGLIPVGDGWISLGSEGGHTSFSPREERELTILRHAWKQYDHVSFERLLSGPGLELMHRALAEAAGLAGAPLSAPEITRRALEQADPTCMDTLDAFCRDAWHRGGEPGRHLGRPGRHLHRRRHRAAPGRLVRPLALSFALRGQGAVQPLRVGDPDLRDRGRQRHLHRRLGDPRLAAAPAGQRRQRHPGPDPARPPGAVAGRAAGGRPCAGAPAPCSATRSPTSRAPRRSASRR
jgi:glucokinase